MNTLTANAPDYPPKMLQKPFFDLTLEMLDCVRDHNFNRLSQICDDDYGIVDINTEGGSEIIRDRAGWEKWFSGLFKTLDQMQAETWSEITNYEAQQTDDMGYSVVDFDQMFVVGEKRMRFSVIATIIWKKVAQEWKEARYHSSLIQIEELNDEVSI
ncbi:nuclear transport factor 2 family protein [Tunicatimonas pelagia]|uniref:nuclear transport factor 2 family protein n=1 Tax=Tunicatimonas pelagia TaxID=931531 RepID=UPI0026670BFB|nr:nuclear transport factor 2 family protein [Tunicatimonas pelagia]WKN41544.1 nuclear transport factor 2 family protein [Tunicatimonas pelagia]